MRSRGSRRLLVPEGVERSDSSFGTGQAPAVDADRALTREVSGDGRLKRRKLLHHRLAPTQTRHSIKQDGDRVFVGREREVRTPEPRQWIPNGGGAHSRAAPCPTAPCEAAGHTECYRRRGTTRSTEEPAPGEAARQGASSRPVRSCRCRPRNRSSCASSRRWHPAARATRPRQWQDADRCRCAVR